MLLLHMLVMALFSTLWYVASSQNRAALRGTNISLACPSKFDQWDLYPTIVKHDPSRSKVVRDGVSTKNTTYIYTSSGEMGSILTVMNVQDKDAGTYYCFNNNNSLEHAMQLTVLGL